MIPNKDSGLYTNLPNALDDEKKAQIEESLSNVILASSLALKIIKGSRKPVSELVDELLEIEVQVAEFLGESLKPNDGSYSKVDLRGSLARALSFIPIKTNHIKASEL